MPWSGAPRDGVQDVEVGFAAELLHRLRPLPQGWDFDPADWIFRGQGDAEWELKTKAVRDDGAAFAEFGFPAASNWSVRSRFEMELLGRFYRGLQDLGITIPSPAPAIRVESMVSAQSEVPSHLRPLQALAQHHGLPTTLLDWSKRAWVAAYFAAADLLDPDNAEKHRATTHLAVWALQRGTFIDTSQRLLFYEPPSSTNPNLLAQAGLFTTHVPDGDVSLERFLPERRAAGHALLLRRFVLPRTEARELLRLLALERVTGASMFPGADGVVRAMRERTWVE